jgi:hypothetical protein
LISQTSAIVQTHFATGTLAAFRTHSRDRLDRLDAPAKAALTAPVPVDLTSFEQFVFLGNGWGVGLADEEAARGCRGVE